MRRVAKADARMKFAEIVGNAEAGERVKLTHYGKTIAVLISTEDLRRLQECEQARERKGKKPRVVTEDSTASRSRRSSNPGRRTSAGRR